MHYSLEELIVMENCMLCEKQTDEHRCSERETPIGYVCESCWNKTCTRCGVLVGTIDKFRHYEDGTPTGYMCDGCWELPPKPLVLVT
jgi:hypothetical protein